MVGKLQHPNIVPIFDAGEEEGRRYVVTEHVHGARTLATYCRLGSLLPIDQVVSIMYKCAKALHYAHSRGVIHRDIKPSNILLTQDGDVRIVDFGIALVADSDVSRLEGVAGSPAYMSPEQVQGLELDCALGPVFARCGDVRDALRPAPVPRRRARQAAAPGRAVGAGVAAQRAAGDPGRTRGRGQLRAAEGPRRALSQRGGVRRGAHARAPEAAREPGRTSTTRSASRCCASCASSTTSRTARSAR